jgi:hypothetical protein
MASNLSPGVLLSTFAAPLLSSEITAGVDSNLAWRPESRHPDAFSDRRRNRYGDSGNGLPDIRTAATRRGILTDERERLQNPATLPRACSGSSLSSSTSNSCKSPIASMASASPVTVSQLFRRPATSLPHQPARTGGLSLGSRVRNVGSSIEFLGRISARCYQKTLMSFADRVRAGAAEKAKRQSEADGRHRKARALPMSTLPGSSPKSVEPFNVQRAGFNAGRGRRLLRCQRSRPV